jgi:hypothetical protein
MRRVATGSGPGAAALRRPLRVGSRDACAVRDVDSNVDVDVDCDGYINGNVDSDVDANAHANCDSNSNGTGHFRHSRRL